MGYKVVLMNVSFLYIHDMIFQRLKVFRIMIVSIMKLIYILYILFNVINFILYSQLFTIIYFF